MAQHDGTSCSNAGTAPSGQPIYGLMGFTSATATTLYLAIDLGRMSIWVPGSNPVEQYNLGPDTYRVWMASPKLAYAVGDGGLVMKWDGNTTWTRVTPPAQNAGANFTSVVALDGASIFTTDLTGAIRRLSASGWVAEPLYDTEQPLQDIAASSISDLWAVGDNGTVVHFPE